MEQIIIIVILTLLLVVCICRSMSMPKRKMYWFYSKTCGHCTRMEPAWEKFAAMCPAYIDVQKINTAENQQMAQDYGVNGVPYVVKEEAGRRDVYEGDRTAQDLYNFATVTL